MKRKHKMACAWLMVFLMLTGIAGCTNNPLETKETYASYYQQKKQQEQQELKGMAENLAVIGREEQDSPGYFSEDYADLLINDTTDEVVQSYHCFEKVYPASITKIMTALLVLEHGNFDDKITLQRDTVLTEDGAVVSTLSKGDTVSVDDLFHTLLIKSANDCAVILAEYIAGSEEAFVDMMNQKAKELGATHTHFVNPHGLHDENHYTTAYDLYLIFKEVVKYDAFVNAVSMKDYTMTYVTSGGREVSEYMQSTNHYLLNEYPVPEGVTMYGGKTGTTSIARSCLMVMTENEQGDRFFSVVLGAEGQDKLYSSMTQLLEKVASGQP